VSNITSKENTRSYKTKYFVFRLCEYQNAGSTRSNSHSISHCDSYSMNIGTFS